MARVFITGSRRTAFYWRPSVTPRQPLAASWNRYKLPITLSHSTKHPHPRRRLDISPNTLSGGPAAEW
jgi:hypothetical protein